MCGSGCGCGPCGGPCVGPCRGCGPCEFIAIPDFWGSRRVEIILMKTFFLRLRLSHALLEEIRGAYALCVVCTMQSSLLQHATQVLLLGAKKLCMRTESPLRKIK